MNMRRWRQILRFLAAVQLLPALESGEETLVGGQAVLEGVMMRSPHAWGIAVRKLSGEIVTHSEPLERPSDQHKWMGWPVVRGVMTLGHAMTLGFRALKFSANTALEEITSDDPGNNQGNAGLDDKDKKDPGKKMEISDWVAGLNMAFSIAFFIFMYKYLPLVAATELKKVNPVFGQQFLFNLVDGLIRIAMFLLFVWGVSLWKDIRRVYEYHGAEHKTVFAFENGDPLDTAAVQKYSTYHPRCGTSFLMTVMIISMIVYMFIPVTTFWARFAERIILLPLIAGVSYEIIRFAAKRFSARSSSSKSSGSLFAFMTAPGLWLQRITTQPPDDSEVECAIIALDEAMKLEKQRGGELVIA
ncbi:MAG: DUF1385 domain-containing protein [Terriglobales bacterium]